MPRERITISIYPAKDDGAATYIIDRETWPLAEGEGLELQAEGPDTLPIQDHISDYVKNFTGKLAHTEPDVVPELWPSRLNIEFQLAMNSLIHQPQDYDNWTQLVEMYDDMSYDNQGEAERMMMQRAKMCANGGYRPFEARMWLQMLDLLAAPRPNPSPKYKTVDLPSEDEMNEEEDITDVIAAQPDQPVTADYDTCTEPDCDCNLGPVETPESNIRAADATQVLTVIRKEQDPV